MAEWLCNRLQTGSEEFDSLSLLLKNAIINAEVAEWLCNRLQTGSGEFDSLPLLFLNVFPEISDYFYKCRRKALFYRRRTYE
jgi:hypothetical protein